MSEPVQPTQPGPSTPPTPSPASSVPVSSVPASPVPPSVRPGVSGAPGVDEDSIRRKLLMGAALLLALASIYAGVFNVGRLAQIVLAAGATIAVVLALTSGSRRRNS